MNRIGDNLIHFGANERLVSALLDAGAKFVVIGGLAMSWHCPTRQADDMDLLVEPTAENSRRVVVALARCNLSDLPQDTFARNGVQVPLKQNFYAELLTPEADGVQFVDVEADSVEARLFGMPVRLASVAALLKMKRRAAISIESQRMKHVGDIELLELLLAARLPSKPRDDD